MPTSWTSRTPSSTSWSARPTPGLSLYEMAATYEESGYSYEGGGFQAATWTARSVPSTSWNARNPV